MTSSPTGGRHRAPSAREARRAARHSARHRATPQSRSARHARKALPGFALPTAAAAALALTATGATVVDASPVGLDLTGSQNIITAERVRQDAAKAKAQAELEEAERVKVEQARLAEAQAAARDAARLEAIQAKAIRANRAAALAAQQRWVEPVDGCPLSSRFGYRWGKLHAGNDFACTMDTPIKAMSSGTVTFAGVMGGYGNKVEITYWDGTVSYYGHMDEITASEGDEVTPGEVVGYSGNSGRSTGPHLHLEIHPDDGEAIDPLPWLKARQLYAELIGSPDAPSAD